MIVPAVRGPLLVDLSTSVVFKAASAEFGTKSEALLMRHERVRIEGLNVDIWEDLP
jgi:hypothetical protein